MMKYVVALVILIAIAAGVYIYATGTPASNMEESTDTTSGMLAEENAVVVSSQRPGNAVQGGTVYLAAPGFLVIHEDTNGAPGAIIGASTLLGVGENTDVVVSLVRASKDGETLYAMLHADTDGNGSFDAAADLPIESRLGGPIHGWFEVSSSASVNVPVSI